jgi:hypothetical protein
VPKPLCRCRPSAQQAVLRWLALGRRLCRPGRRAAPGCRPVILGAGRTLFSELGVRLQLDRTRILESPYAPHLLHSELTGSPSRLHSSRTRGDGPRSISPVGGDSGPNRRFAPTVYRGSGTERRDRTTTGGGGLRAPDAGSGASRRTPWERVTTGTALSSEPGRSSAVGTLSEDDRRALRRRAALR